MLSSQKQLAIYKCEGLTDVTSFRFIHTVTLSDCPNISDIRPLNGVNCLKLFRCKGIRDISGLGNHNCLKLETLSDDVTGFDCFLHIPHVSLTDFPIEDVGILQYAKSVELNKCWNVIDVRALKNVRKVNIRTTELLIGLDELGEVSELILYLRLDQVLNDNIITHFQNRRLKLANGDLQISSLRIFSNTIEHLTIQFIGAFPLFINEGQGSIFTHLTSLTLIGLSLQSFEGLWSIPTIQLCMCDGFRSLQGLGGNRCVEIESCKDLEDISSLVTVPIVTIRYCSQLTKESYDCLKNVPRLKVVEK